MTETSTPRGRGVILLGIDTQIGLAMMRELGEHGVQVFGIARTVRAVGLHSRYLTRGYVHPQRDDALLDLMLEIAQHHAAPFVMTVSEGDILFLNRQRERLPGLRLLIPDLSAIETVIDKDKVYRVAEGIGMRVPRSYDPNGDIDAALSKGFRFPVVLKWAFPNRALPLLKAHGLRFLKAEYCHTETELQQALERYKPMQYFPLVQEYVPGNGLGHMLFMHQGEAVLRFQHLREHEWPPEGGYSTQCRSLPADGLAELMAQSIALLRAVDWEGPAMVEYRFDPRTNNAVLMEINGRFWGSLPLAYHSGARFTWLYYCLKGLGQCVPPDAPMYRAGVRCRFGIPETKRLLRILFQRDLIHDRTLHFNRFLELTKYFGYFFHPAHRYYVWSVRDPQPFVHDVLGLLRRLLPIRSR